MQVGDLVNIAFDSPQPPGIIIGIVDNYAVYKVFWVGEIHSVGGSMLEVISEN